MGEFLYTWLVDNLYALHEFYICLSYASIMYEHHLHTNPPELYLHITNTVLWKKILSRMVYLWLYINYTYFWLMYSWRIQMVGSVIYLFPCSYHDGVSLSIYIYIYILLRNVHKCTYTWIYLFYKTAFSSHRFIPYCHNHQHQYQRRYYIIINRQIPFHILISWKHTCLLSKEWLYR